MATFSVVIAAFNRETTLTETLDGLRAQSFTGWEAVVVDDGSTDRTFEVATEIARRDPRIRVVRTENRGVGAARNRGIAEARNPWLLFLDADDWMEPGALTAFAAAIDGDPTAELVNGACTRLMPDGSEVLEDRPAPGQNLFAAFARTCVFSIHTSVVRADLVRALGGFDTSLVTCEDWDLWLRVSRVGARVVSIADAVACYRIRPGSASRDGRRLVADALEVIGRAHRHDDRLHGLDRPVADPLPATHARAPQVYVAAYGAGLEAAVERDAAAVLELLTPGVAADVDPHGLATTLVHAVVGARAVAPGAWGRMPTAVHEQLQRFIDGLGALVGDHWLSFSTTQALGEEVLRLADEHAELTIGRTHVVPVDCDGPIGDVAVRPDAERVMLSVLCGGSRLGTVVLPAVGAVVPAAVVADAVADEHGWDVLGRFFASHVYPELDVRRDGARVEARRGGVLLGVAGRESGMDDAAQIHAAAGWTVLLQEVWGRRAWPRPAFYDERVRTRVERAAPRISAAALTAVEVADELPLITGADGPLDVPVRVAGVPLARVRVVPRRGVVSPHALRSAITHAAGFELCHLAVREGVLLFDGARHLPLRGRLAELARRRAAIPEDNGYLPGWHAVARGLAVGEGTTLLLGRRRQGALSGASSRLAMLPLGVADEALDLAGRTRQPVARLGDDGAPGAIVYAPFIVDPGRDPVEFGPRSRARAQDFDRRVHRGERDTGVAAGEARRAAVQAMLPARLEQVLEVGCGDGALTAALAERARAVTAVDISWSALQRAEASCGDRPNVVFVQADAFTEPLSGGHDAVICADVLRHAASRAHQRHVARQLAGAVRPGGSLIVCTSAAHAAEARRTLAGERGLVLREEARPSDHVVLRYERVSRASSPRGSGLGWRPRPPRRRAGRNRTGVPGAASERALPVLMYHRIAPTGDPRARRWRLTPGEFEEQLAYLREQGYRSVDVEEWASVVGQDRTLANRAVVLTFDDGFADFAEHALPLIDRYGFRAEVFVVTGHVGGHDGWDQGWDRRERLMDWDTLASLPEKLVRIGSHTVSHTPLTTLSPDDAARELLRSRITLEDRLGRRVDSIAYPYGLVDGAIQRLAGAVGYETGYTTRPSWAYPTRNHLCLPRLEARSGEAIDAFARAVSAPPT